MRKGSKKLQAEHGAADLEDGTMHKGHIHSPARNRHAVYQHFTAHPGTDQQPCSVLPGEVQVMGADPGTGDDQVAGAQRSQHAFAGNRKPGVSGQFVAAG